MFITKTIQQIKSTEVFHAAEPGCRKALLLHAMLVLTVAPTLSVWESETVLVKDRDEKYQLLP